MHEEINEKSVNLAVRVGKLTADELKKALDKVLASMKPQPGKAKTAAKGTKKPELKHGKQTLIQLKKHNDGLTPVELTSPDLRLLNSEMKKAKVDFSVSKDGKRKYILHFKGKEADDVTRAFKNYTGKLTQRANKPSISKTLTAAKAAAQALNNGRDKVKNRDKGAR